MLQNLYDLADMKVMYEILDSRAFTEFCCINSPDEVPDGDTIGRFRNLLNKYGSQQTIFETVVDLLLKRGLLLKKGTIVDSTFIEAPSSTKNKISLKHSAWLPGVLFWLLEQSIYLSVCVYVYYPSGSCTLFQERNKYVDQHRCGL